jgi:DNA polymerase III subunit gamma/tau
MLIRRMTESGANDLITIYRPCTIDEVIGQEINKKIIKNNLTKGTTPHNLLLTGPSGCGKTTAARVVALGLNCESIKEGSTAEPCLTCDSCVSILNHASFDVLEINVGEAGGKDSVDKITQDLSYSPVMSRNKVLIFDEAHKLTTAAQDLLLKKIEDGFSHVYFIFCTNKPEKLLVEFTGRNINMHFGYMTDDFFRGALINICDFEGITYKLDIVEYIVATAKGVPREAIANLKKVIDEESWELENVKLILENHALDEEHPNIMEIGKCLYGRKFKDAVAILTKLKSIPEEQIRIATAGFFTARLKWCKTTTEGDKLSAVLDVITTPILYTGKPAHHILVNYFYKITKIMRG